MPATNHAGYSCYTYTPERGHTVGQVRSTKAEAQADMTQLPAGGEYAVREAVWLKGEIV